MKRRRVASLIVAPVLALVAGGTLSVAAATSAGATSSSSGASLGATFGASGHASHGVGSHGKMDGKTYECTSGNVPAGTYSSVKITGDCYMPTGTVKVLGDLSVAPGALLDAVTPGDPSSAPVVPATVIVGGNVWVGKGAVLLFGCSPNISCSMPPGITYDRIGGNLTADGALGVVLHSASVDGNVSLRGGGGGAAAENCSSVTQPPSTPVPPAPWSDDPGLLFTPVYSDFEDTTIGGNLMVKDLTSCWLGTLRTQVGGDATFSNNTMGDPDGNEIVNNLVQGDMKCFGNTAGGVPAVQFGDAMAAPNLVAGKAKGQCGFDVMVYNPAPEAVAPATCTPPTVPPTCVSEHISVPTSSLTTYKGTHTVTAPDEVTLSLGTTASGDVLSAAINNVVLGGDGLTGTETYDATKQLGSTGEAVIETTHPDGSESFMAIDNCDCSFQGQSGLISIRAYGTATPDGKVKGTFLVTSGGPGSGGLATLAGYGKFTSAGEPQGTLKLIEHLAIT